MIALYNILLHAGFGIKFSSLIDDMKDEPYYLLGGKYGMDPLYLHYKLTSLFNAKNVIYVESLNNSSTYDSIVFFYLYKVKGSDWGAHYFVATREPKGEYTVHNGEVPFSGPASQVWFSQSGNSQVYYIDSTIWGINYK